VTDFRQVMGELHDPDAPGVPWVPRSRSLRAFWHASCPTGEALESGLEQEARPLRGKRMREQPQSEVNMTPMLDVVFIMLIFFIVTASFVKEAGVDVNRPPAQTAVSKAQGNILVAITENGQIWIDRRQVDPRSLRANIERLHAENPQGSMVIQADAKSQNHLLVQVMDAARLAGVSQVAISAEGNN